jgi:hypothetical protein
MAWTLHRDTFPKIVASAALVANVPVKPLAGTADKVVLAASVNDYPLGFTIASGASAGNPIAIVTEGVVKAICSASVGAGAEVGVASTNGGLGPVSGASGLTKYVVGEAQNSAAAGDTFSVQLRVRQIDAQV